MKSFSTFVSSEPLHEKLIVIGGGADYGQIVFLVGGAGSGKGYVLDKFMEGNKFKVRDVDKWKSAFLKLEAEYDKIAGLPPCEIDERGKPIRTGKCNPYGAIHGLDLRKPGDVFELHNFVAALGIKNSTLDLMLQTAEKGHLPNILFDITLRGNVLEDYISKLLKVGYDPKNIHLVWVLADYRTAVVRNNSRDRIVPEDVLLSTHEKTAQSVVSILKGNLPEGLDGSLIVILNNTEETKYYEKTSTVKDFSYLSIKKPGKEIQYNSTTKEKLNTWILNNIPKTDITSDIFDNPV